MLSEKEYNKRVRTKVRELLEVCRENKTPIFVSGMIVNDEGKISEINDIVTAQEVNCADQVGKDNKQAEFIKVINGFKACPTSEAAGLDWLIDNPNQYENED